MDWVLSLGCPGSYVLVQKYGQTHVHSNRKGDGLEKEKVISKRVGDWLGLEKAQRHRDVQ